jgi:hypothetical protein
LTVVRNRVYHTGRRKRRRQRRKKEAANEASKLTGKGQTNW